MALACWRMGGSGGSAAAAAIASAGVIEVMERRYAKREVVVDSPGSSGPDDWVGSEGPVRAGGALAREREVRARPAGEAWRLEVLRALQSGPFV